MGSVQAEATRYWSAARCNRFYTHAGIGEAFTVFLRKIMNGNQWLSGRVMDGPLFHALK